MGYLGALPRVALRDDAPRGIFAKMKREGGAFR
jgi:hypothetical protein